MGKKNIFAFLVCFSMMLGCAGNSVKDFNKKLDQLDKKGIVLATVTFENKIDKTNTLQPGAFVMSDPSDHAEQEYALYGSDHFRVLTDDKKIWLIVLQLNEGNYFLSSVRGVVLGGFFIPVFEAPIGKDLQSKDNEIVYIGSIHLVLRKKLSKEEKSAGIFVAGHIIHQVAIAGATIDVTINDKYQKDMKEFEKVFPNIKGYSIEKRIL